MKNKLKLINGDCFDVLKKIETWSIDLIPLIFIIFSPF